MDTVLNIDRLLFEFIHFKLGNSVFDYYLPILRFKYTWVPLYVFIVSYLFFNLKNHAWLILLFTLIAVGTADGISSHLIKKNVKRVRPCNTEEIRVVPRIDCGSGYSFTSSHAANHFALSLFLILTIAKRRYVQLLLWSWAIIISISQVYVGAHYPFDVIFGGILGVVIAYAIWFLYNRINQLINKSV